MAKGANNVHERLGNFHVYNDNEVCLGVASVELPELEGMSDTVSGAGIAGELETPITGHFGSMTTTITWRTITEDLAFLADNSKTHALTMRGYNQVHDAANGESKEVPVRVVMQVKPKNTSLGSFEVGATTDSECEFEVYSMKLFINNKEKIAVDKLNFVYRINGKDKLAGARKALGMA